MQHIQITVFSSTVNLYLYNIELKYIKYIDDRSETFDENTEIITLIKNLYVLALENPIPLNLLEDEFLKYQSMSKKDISNDIWKFAAVYEKNTYHRMDTIWDYFRKPMPLLDKTVLSVFTIPYSSTADERVFLMTKKSKIEFRANLELLNR